ncbi:MAG: GNAT family N-acetyltransferase [Gemmatimonadaceae bacterium]
MIPTSGTYPRWSRGQFEVDTDPGRVDLSVVHDFLSRQSYWAAGIPRAVVERAVRHSIVFGLYHGVRQVGFARVITDRATFAYVADVFVIDTYRGQGLGKWLMECVSAHPALQGLRRWLLATRDAHGLYRQAGWESLRDPTLFMERSDPNVYARLAPRQAGNDPLGDRARCHW